MIEARLTRESLIGGWSVQTTFGAPCLGELFLRPDLTYANSLSGPITAQHWGYWSLDDCGEFQFIRFDLEGANPQQRAGACDSETAPWPDFVLTMILSGDAQRVITQDGRWTRSQASAAVAGAPTAAPSRRSRQVMSNSTPTDEAFPEYCEL